MYKADFEQISTLISVINNNIEIIESQKITSVKMLKREIIKYYAISMAIFTIQNKLIELGEELVYSLEKNIYPKTYNDIAKILLNQKIITHTQFKTFKSFIEYRNEIAHEYDDITENEIFWCLKNLDFVKDIIKISKEKLLK